MRLESHGFVAVIPVYAGATQTHSAADALKLLNALPEKLLEARVSYAKKEFNEPLRNVSPELGDYIHCAPC
ncbi:hypothetical protein ACQ0P8_16200 (plasmid) [Halodesulfovibrio aestuarii]|nr:hypothetical protein [Halodesulfovibrio aestuarii]